MHLEVIPMGSTRTAVSVLPPVVAAILRPAPLAPLALAAKHVLRAVVRHHPGIFERLGTHAHKRFGLQPTDLPFAFVLRPAPPSPTVRIVRHLPQRGWDARIIGSIAALAGLADGRFDGDALFFSRDLVVEGDIEAVVALRNAIDDAGLDLIHEATAVFGPFAKPAEAAARRAIGIADKLVRALSISRRAARWN